MQTLLPAHIWLTGNIPDPTGPLRAGDAGDPAAASKALRAALTTAIVDATEVERLAELVRTVGASATDTGDQAELETVSAGRDATCKRSTGRKRETFSCRRSRTVGYVMLGQVKARKRLTGLKRNTSSCHRSRTAGHVILAQVKTCKRSTWLKRKTFSCRRSRTAGYVMLAQVKYTQCTSSGPTAG